MAKTCVRKPLARTWCSPLRCIIASALLLSASISVAQTPPSGAELRAAVIVAILRFTSWQTAAVDEVGEDEHVNNVRLCAVGEPLSQPFLLPVSGLQKVAGHTLLVDALPPQEVAASECDALVVGAKLAARDFAAVRLQAEAEGVLTICDGCRDAVAVDTIIQLKLFKQRVRFEVNLAKARASGVKLDAQLLELASTVRK